ncbi:gluconokinase [Arenicella chitinivorans]|uniref:Gluconokinase n=1 Tax=Arenicella chitinivorans TaxID=1329800 RepID=A0A918RGH7_9GAMM|nr:gluconokinase, GntK/IdnK-type [Arenicella chitinivorans]GGZ97945.1 gluconokinase [Arenicella chitinivorans]
MDKPNLVICMGVSGTGKSTLGRALASQLRWLFIEADDFHCAENKAWMASGKPLTNTMREPWIKALLTELELRCAAQQNCVLAYSGLVRAHRDRFRALHFQIQFVHLSASPEVLESRLAERQNHFMPTSLLTSQLATLDISADEPDVLTLDAQRPTSTLVTLVQKALQHA